MTHRLIMQLDDISSCEDNARHDHTQCRNIHVLALVCALDARGRPVNTFEGSSKRELVDNPRSRGREQNAGGHSPSPRHLDVSTELRVCTVSRVRKPWTPSGVISVCRFAHRSLADRGHPVPRHELWCAKSSSGR